MFVTKSGREIPGLQRDTVTDKGCAMCLFQTVPAVRQDMFGIDITVPVLRPTHFGPGFQSSVSCGMTEREFEGIQVVIRFVPCVDDTVIPYLAVLDGFLLFPAFIFDIIEIHIYIQIPDLSLVIGIYRMVAGRVGGFRKNIMYVVVCRSIGCDIHIGHPSAVSFHTESTGILSPE